MTPIEIRNYLINNGYDSKPEKADNGMFTCNMWVNDVKVLKGKVKYNCWKKAERETNKIFYTMLIGKVQD